jgi:hypothetical protein
VWIVPIDVSTKKSAKLLKKSTLEVIPRARRCLAMAIAGWGGGSLRLASTPLADAAPQQLK